MDPNPLQYQTPDENQPLYRAAMLSAGVVALVIVIALGVNFVVHANKGQGATAKRDYETSPDDSINGMRHALSDDPGSSPVAGGGGGYFPSSQTMTARTDGFNSVPVAHFDGNQGPTIFATPNVRGSWGMQPRDLPPLSAGAMRDWGSVSPDSLAELINGY